MSFACGALRVIILGRPRAGGTSTEPSSKTRKGENGSMLNQSRQRPRQLLLFARNFFKYPKLLGSMVPSSPSLVNQLMTKVDWQRAKVVVEYGPGIGNITREILQRLQPDAMLVAIELNPEFVAYLREQIQDPRLHVVYGSASDVADILAKLKLNHADYIISGIPYSTLPDAVRRKIVRESRRLLDPTGALVVYQFTRTVLPYLKPLFGQVQQDFTLFNILPARIFYCTC
jgi:phospholipid N-methyltransferase